MAFENLKKAGIKILLGLIKRDFLQKKDSIKSVNGNVPDANGNVQVNTVPYAQNLESASTRRNTDSFIQRMTGGAGSIGGGSAWLVKLFGNSSHDNHTAESLTLTCTNDSLTVTINRDTFVSYVADSGTIELEYTTEWSADPATYGVTVTGTPQNGDVITIVYVKVSGHIDFAYPTEMVSTGWNLFDLTDGFAKVVKYDHGYRIEGSYSEVKFSSTFTGTRTSVTVSESGDFNVTQDGYIWVTDYSDDTAIYPTWEDWSEGHPGEYEGYEETVVSLASIMSSKFPNGLMKIGNVADEIDLNLGQTISRIAVLEYTTANLNTVKGYGCDYEFDEEHIYYVRSSANVGYVTVNGQYTADDHGIEFFRYTETDGSETIPHPEIAVGVEIIYGTNLKNKLERDVLTISQQTLTAGQKAQVLNNIGAASQAALGIVGAIASKMETNAVSVSNATNTHLTSITLDKGVYILQAVASFAANGTGLRQLYLSLTRAGSLLNRFCTSTNGSVASGAITRIALTSILEVTQDNTVIYLVGNQTSGSTLSVDGIGIQVARLK